MPLGSGFMASKYASLGWRIVRVWGVKEQGVCSCYKNGDCGTPGKHPVGEAWGTRTSNDEEEILNWIEEGFNIGLLLGPRSGVIDVELDSEEAIDAWDKLDLGEIWTPTYSAGRGPHRLFKWSETLPPVSIKKPMGLEMRIGNVGTDIQSILPPSRHHSGAYYQWKEGLSPEDVEIQELPQKLLELLLNTSDGDERYRKPARLAMHEKIPNGERNESVHKFAVREAFRCGPDLDDPNEQQDLLAKVRAINLLNCKPPLPDNEVMSLYRSAVQYVRKTRAAEISPAAAIEASETGSRQVKVEQNGYVRTLTVEGLSYGPLVPGSDSSPEWKPGNWKLTVVHSDPLEYRLHAQAWKKWTADGTGNVSLSVDQYRSATKVAHAVLAATGVVMLDTEPKKWHGIWEGGYKVFDHGDDGKKKERVALGLKAKLLDNVEHEWPGASSLRYVILAGWLYDRLSQASQPSDDDIPDPNGRASWRKDDTLWFSWSKVWEDIERQHRVIEGERLKIKRRLLARIGGDIKDFKHSEFRHVGGTRKSYVVWGRKEFAALESMANETPGE